MIIYLDELNIYYLTCNNDIRKSHLLNELSDFSKNIYEINPITNISKNKSGSSGWLKMIDLASKHIDNNKSFKPIIFLEDDIKKTDNFKNNIEIPDNTDIIYLGISLWGRSLKNSYRRTVCYDNINSDTIKIYNMLSSHSIMVCSIRGLLALNRCFMESYFKDEVWDNFTSKIQPYLNVYALKKPLFYQYAKIGGCEQDTKIIVDENFSQKKEWEIEKKQWNNNSHISIITSYDYEKYL